MMPSELWGTSMKTYQEIFNASAKHLLTQMERSLDPEGEYCRYRYKKEDGKTLMCALGVLIPDNKYSPDIEGAIPQYFDGKDKPPYPSSSGALLMKIFQEIDLPTDSKGIMFLRDLQIIHDEYQPVDWKYHLRMLADKYGLTFSVT